MADEKSIMTVAQGGDIVALPSYLKEGDTRGTEHLTKDDIAMPRIGIAQQMSPQLNPTESQWIEGLKMGEMFNNVTDGVLGKGPLEFTIVRADPPRGVEFVPREEGGGIKDPNVPLNDPRMMFGPDGERPIATKFYDFIIMLLGTQELIALSFKSTGLKVARQLNSLMKYPVRAIGAGGVPTIARVPSFAKKYTLSVVTEKNSKGVYYNFSVKAVGFVDEMTFKLAEQFYLAIKDKDIVIEREPGADDDPTNFDTSKMEDDGHDGAPSM